jgi:hypothetical protein
MTTSWAHLVRGQFGRALRANVAGTCLGLATMAVVPWLLLSARRGRWLWRSPSVEVATIAAVAVVGVALIDWLVRLLVD